MNMKQPLPLAAVRFPNRISLNLHADREDATTPVLDARPTISMTAGLGEVPTPSKTRFRPTK